MQNTILDQDQGSANAGVLTTEAISHLKTTKGWTKFLSIMGFVFLGFLVIIALSIGVLIQKLPPSIARSLPTTMLTIVYLVMALIYFFPVYYLFNFSSSLGRALKSNSSQDMTKAFSSLKSHYKFIGILMIIMLVIYGLGILLTAIAFATR
ncbi:MAG: hypothetical protein K2X86_03095 [Cytophagaceae bacterium]|nr:hypothetical protein [Cytophagaceae bacterium]